MILSTGLELELNTSTRSMCFQRNLGFFLTIHYLTMGLAVVEKKAFR